MRPLDLIPIDLALAVAFDDDASLEGRWSAPLLQRASMHHADLRDQILKLPGSDLPWGGFVAIDLERGTVVGTCGFKGAPTSDHAIEIAYHTFPSFEGRGYATAMARALVEIAWSNPALCSVCAHTLPQASASTRVLGKLGMLHVGEVTDAVEGLVWRWRLPRPAPATRG